jgi:hypothetical protein
MRAIDLLGAAVYDVDGRPVGAVRDLRFQAGGPAVKDSGRPAYRLVALECGAGGLAHRLGYGHRELAGPWPLTILLRRLARRSVVVDWGDIATIDGGKISLSTRAESLRRVGDGAP